MPASQAITAMMWNAFTQSYMRRVLSSGGADACHQLFNMRDRCVRQHAVAEIEDKWSCFEVFHDSLDRAIKRAAADQERHRIEIALNRLAPLQLVACKSEIDGPVEPDRSDRYSIDVPFQPAAGAARKSDELRCWNLRAHGCNDACARFNATSIKFVIRQYAGPAIEYLHGIDAGLELPDQIRRRSVHKNVEQFGK